MAESGLLTIKVRMPPRKRSEQASPPAATHSLATLTSGAGEEAKALIGDAVKQGMAVAVRSRKPLVIERLEFGKKKAALENAGRGRARMLSSFAYRQAIRSLRAAFRAESRSARSIPPIPPTSERSTTRLVLGSAFIRAQRLLSPVEV